MLLPIGDDNPRERTPFVHYAILGVNVAVFLYMLTLSDAGMNAFFLRWGMRPDHFSLVTLFTSVYLHAGLGHIFGNMLFLWIVGDNVEDRMGHVGYLIFYHAAGAAATLAYVAFTPDVTVPLVGASGAISAVMGAYAVFFPNAKIKIWYWIFLFFTNIIYVSAKWAVALWFLEQVLLRLLVGRAGIAYEAHIGGLLFGVAVALALKGLVLKPVDPARRIVDTGEGERAAAAPPETAGVAAAEISEALDAGQADEAFRLFTRSAGGADAEPVGEFTLARLGAALMGAGAYGPASRVYEEMLRSWPSGPLSPEAAFRLGVIQSRVRKDYLRARDNLLRAHGSHPDAARRAQALDELKRIDAHLRSNLFRRDE